MDEPQPTYAPSPIPVTFPLPATDGALLVEGPAGSGKTRALVRSVASLLNNGTPPRDILVLCATPAACGRLSQLLAQVGDGAAEVEVTTPRALGLQVLGTPEAAAATGRDARLLAPFEIDFLMEDLKTCGLKSKRLREMTGFFLKTISELGDDERGDWLLGPEEHKVFSLLKTCLATCRGVLEQEVANLASRYLAAHPAALEQAGRAHVFVDDYQLLSRASQVLANLVARCSVTVTADRAACVEVFDSYPNPAGVDEFAGANPGLSVRTLQVPETGGRPADMREAAASLRETQAFAPSGGSLRAVCSPSPNDEIGTVVDLVRARIAAGTQPSDVYVVASCPTWAKSLVRAFGQTGVPVSQAPDPRALSGDVRNTERSKASLMLTALELAANPGDAVAWRSWCGFGDHLAGSGSMVWLRAFATERALSLDAALAALAGCAVDAAPGNGMAKTLPANAEVAGLVAAWNRGVQVTKAVQGLRGSALLERLARELFGEGAAIPPALLAFLPTGSVLEEADAAALAAHAQRCVASPKGAATGVRIGDAAGLTGLEPRLVVFAGFVNGLFPKRSSLDAAELSHEKRAAALERDARLLAFALEHAESEAVVSYFAHIELEPAELLGLKIDRIGMKNGVRTARCSPSLFLQP